MLKGVSAVLISGASAGVRRTFSAGVSRSASSSYRLDLESAEAKARVFRRCAGINSLGLCKQVLVLQD
jgi:hypothetical protein